MLSNASFFIAYSSTVDHMSLARFGTGDTAFSHIESSFVKSPEDPHLCRHRQDENDPQGVDLPSPEKFTLRSRGRSRNSGPVLRLHLNEAEGCLRLSGRMRYFEFVNRVRDLDFECRNGRSRNR